MNIHKKIEELHDLFQIFDDPMDIYTQIIEFGKKNKGLDELDKNEKNKIYGCASSAWVKTEKQNNMFLISTDSDTFIVKGLLNILEFLLNGATKKEIEEVNLKDILKNIGLENSITSQRTNGFLSALNKIKEQINQYE